MKAPAQSPAQLLGARPRADLCQCRRGRRGPRGLGSRARGRGATEAAGGQPRGGLPRRPAHAATGAGAGILRTRSAGDAVSGLGLPALRPGVAAWRHPGATADHAGAAGAAGGQRQAADRADHGQRHRAAGAGARNHRRAGAVGGARPCRADGFHRVVAGAQWLQPLLHGARARRICGSRRHPRSVSGRARSARAVRFLRRLAGIDPQLRRRDPAHAARHARARPGADLGISTGHRDHPPVPDGLCRGVRRPRARRSALRGRQRRPPPSRHGALAAAVPGEDGYAVRLSRRRAGRDRAAERGCRARALQADRGLLRGAARGDGASRRRRGLQAVAARSALSDRGRMDQTARSRPRWRG